MKKECDENEAMHKAATLCGKGEQCIAQINEKLARWGLDTEARNRIIGTLIREKYIDEKRFARAYALDKFRYNKWGRIKINNNLRALKISAADCRDGIAAIETDEYRRSLTEILRAKSNSVKAYSTYERNAKLARFALGRGFETEEIMLCLSDME